MTISKISDVEIILKFLVIELGLMVTLLVLLLVLTWYLPISTSQVSIIVSPINSTYILDAISVAKSSVYIEAYELTYQPLVNELIDLAGRGVQVYVVLSGNVYGGIPEEEYYLVERLRDAGVHVSFNEMYAYVHSKVFVIDNTTVILGSINPTYSGFERDLGIDLVIENSTIATIYAQIILSDYYNETVEQIDYPGIVVSPINSANYIEQLLSQPGSLYMAIEELYPSSGMYDLIKQHTERVILVGPHSENEEAVNELGAIMLGNLTAKAIVINDYVYIGSVNLDLTSLNENRELGIIIQNPVVANEVKAIILQWQGGQPQPGTAPTTAQTTQGGWTGEEVLVTVLVIMLVILTAIVQTFRRLSGQRRHRRYVRHTH